MKKTAIIALSFAFLAVAAGAGAKKGTGMADFSKPLPVSNKNVELEAKKALSKKEIKEIEDMEAMGKPDNLAAASKDKPVASSSAATGILGVDLAPGARKYAIVIGLANYPGVSTTADDALLPDLCVQQVPDNVPDYGDEVKDNCKDGDSVNMEAALLGKYNFDRVVRLSDSEATFDNIYEAVQEIKGNLTQDDELVFFFSGHGVTSADGTGIVVYDQKYDEAAFMDTDTPYTDPETGEIYANYAEYYAAAGYDPSAYIWNSQIKDWFADSKTSRIVFVFDTCHAGGMSVLAGSGREVVMSAQENQSANTFYLGGESNGDYIHDSEGLFTHYFVLRGLDDGRADGYNALKKNDPAKYDGRVVVEEAFQYAKEIISSYQTPVLSDQFTNDLYLDFQ
ncbi:MAG: caspase family protein [Candidatus Moranbacteria bacterium]|nr:caspase family protein [Candidatus Moranbacteria bacterium]